MECNFKANVVYVVGTCFSEREKLAAPFSTSQQLVWVSINVFLGFYFSSAPGLSFQIFLLRSWGENFYNIFSCLRHLLWQAQLFPHSPQSHRQRDTAGLIGNNPSAVTTVAYRSFSGQSKRYLFYHRSSEHTAFQLLMVWKCCSIWVFRNTVKFFFCITTYILTGFCVCTILRLISAKRKFDDVSNYADVMCPLLLMSHDC